MWQFEETGVISAVKEQAGIDPDVWHCPCGCASAIVYARDVRALWVSCTLVPEQLPAVYALKDPPVGLESIQIIDPLPPPSGLPVFGFETAQEVQQFLSTIHGRGSEQLAERLLNAFHGVTSGN